MKTPKPQFLRGYSIEILSRWKTGISPDVVTTHFAFTGSGILPIVHLRRDAAIQTKRGFVAEGFTCRIVPVLYAEPVIVPSTKPRRWSHPAKKTS